MDDEEKQEQVIDGLRKYQYPRLDVATLVLDIVNREELIERNITSISSDTSRNILTTYFQTKAQCDHRDIERTNTNRSDEGLDLQEDIQQYENNEPIFVLISDEWIPGIISRHVSFDEIDGNSYLVKYGAGRLGVFNEIDISGTPGRHQWNDDDRTDPTLAQRMGYIKDCMNAGVTDIASLWSCNGFFTQLFSVTGGHYDQ